MLSECPSQSRKIKSARCHLHEVTNAIKCKTHKECGGFWRLEGGRDGVNLARWEPSSELAHDVHILIIPLKMVTACTVTCIFVVVFKNHSWIRNSTLGIYYVKKQSWPRVVVYTCNPSTDKVQERMVSLRSAWATQWGLITTTTKQKLSMLLCV